MDKTIIHRKKTLIPSEQVFSLADTSKSSCEEVQTRIETFQPPEAVHPVPEIEKADPLIGKNVQSLKEDVQPIRDSVHISSKEAAQDPREAVQLRREAAGDPREAVLLRRAAAQDRREAIQLQREAVHNRREDIHARRKDVQGLREAILIHRESVLAQDDVQNGTDAQTIKGILYDISGCRGLLREARYLREKASVAWSEASRIRGESKEAYDELVEDRKEFLKLFQDSYRCSNKGFNRKLAEARKESKRTDRESNQTYNEIEQTGREALQTQKDNIQTRSEETLRRKEKCQTTKECKFFEAIGLHTPVRSRRDHVEAIKRILHTCKSVAEAINEAIEIDVSALKTVIESVLDSINTEDKSLKFRRPHGQQDVERDVGQQANGSYPTRSRTNSGQNRQVSEDPTIPEIKTSWNLDSDKERRDDDYCEPEESNSTTSEKEELDVGICSCS